MKQTINSVAYVSPKVDFLLVESEGILCASDPFSGLTSGNHSGFREGDGLDF